jgi:hypothetical protein
MTPSSLRSEESAVTELKIGEGEAFRLTRALLLPND